MSDNYNISYSYQATPSQPPPPQTSGADEELVAFTDCDSVDLNNGSTLLMNRGNGRQIAVAPEVVTALTYCNTFQTRLDHAHALSKSLPQLQGQKADVNKVLTMVDEAGMLLHASSIARQLATEQTSPGTLAPTRVFIISCDRPAALARLLESILESSRIGIHESLCVVDDSRDPDNGKQNRELVAKFNQRSPKSMGYLGTEAQQNFMQQLILAHPGHEAAIRFLIDRQRWSSSKSYGLARNLCLLWSVGFRCIVLDDDVLCRTVIPPGQESTISFGGGSGRELKAFSSEQELLEQAFYSDTDPLSGHASCLGMTLGQALTTLNGSAVQPTNLRGANAAMLNTLTSQSPVLVSQCGSWGDPGVPGTSWLASLGEQSVENLLNSPGGLSQAMDTRHYWLGRKQPNISKMAVMSQVTGLDNSQLLPPYFPVSRGEDYLFASMLVTLHPDSAVLDYNWAVPHLPLAARGGDKATPGVPRGGLGMCARYLADRVQYHPGVSAVTRLTQLADQLRTISEREPVSLLATFRRELAHEQAALLQQFNNGLQSPAAQANPEWRDFLERGAQSVSSALQTPANPMQIPEVPAGLDGQALVQTFKQGLAGFSAGLSAWAELRESAAGVSQGMLDRGDLIP